MGGSRSRTVLIYELVTGGGYVGSHLAIPWVGPGAAMRRALAADFAAVAGVRVVVTLDDRLDDEPGPWEVVRVGPGWTTERLIALADAAAVDYLLPIAPETGGRLASLTRIVGRGTATVLASEPAAIELAGDKSRLGTHLQGLGIASPECRSVDDDELFPREFSYPAVLKPRDGAGSIDTFYIAGPQARYPWELEPEDAILQPFVPGEPMSATFLVAADGRALLIGVGRQRIEIREDGRIVYRGGVIPAGPDPSCDEARRAVAAMDGLRGLVGVDFVRDPATGRDTILEINPRPTTSVVGLTRLLPPGALAAAWLAAVDGTLDGSIDLASLVHARGPIAFEADGTSRPDPGRDW